MASIFSIMYIPTNDSIINYNEIPSSIGSPSKSTKHKRTVNSLDPCKKSEPGSNYLKKEDFRNTATK